MLISVICRRAAIGIGRQQAKNIVVQTLRRTTAMSVEPRGVMFEDFAIAVLAAAIAATAWLLPALPAHADVMGNHSASTAGPLDE